MDNPAFVIGMRLVSDLNSQKSLAAIRNSRVRRKRAYVLPETADRLNASPELMRRLSNNGWNVIRAELDVLLEEVIKAQLEHDMQREIV